MTDTAKHRCSTRRALLAAAAAAVLAGCAGGMEDLETWVAEEKAKPGGGIEGLPQPKLFETFSYEAQELRSPFSPDAGQSAQSLAAAAAQGGAGPRPDPNRNREFLEEYPLDALRMVGTLELRGTLFALVRDSDGGVHRVRVGNYMGQNHGKIVDIDDGEIRLTEIVLDTKGVWVSRDASLVLQ
jgi:type IV pilus assembly protein PilP